MGNFFYRRKQLPKPLIPQLLYQSNMIDIEEFNNKYNIAIEMLETKILKLNFKLDNITILLHKNHDYIIEFENKINEMYKFCKKNRKQINKNRSVLINNNINSNKLNYNINKKCYILSKKIYNIYHKIKTIKDIKFSDSDDLEEYYKKEEEIEEDNDVFIDEKEYKNSSNSEKSIDKINDEYNIDNKNNTNNIKMNLTNYNYIT